MKTLARTTLTLCVLLSSAWADTFVERTTGKTIEGRFLGSVFRDGHQTFYVKLGDGKTVTLRKDEWEHKTGGATPTAKPQPKGGNTMAVDFGAETKGDEPSAQTKTVLATGIGVSPDKARQAAFSSAIEQTVGLLVDSETLVKNDVLVREQILTISRGYIEKFDVLKEWQADGLHHAHIRAEVSVTRLVEKLTANNIAVKKMDGELISMQATNDVKNEEQAGELFSKIMDDYTIEKLFKVEIDGKPEVVKKDAVRATLKVKVKLSPDWEYWSRMQVRLERLLRTIATKQSAFITKSFSILMGAERIAVVDRKVAQDIPKRLEGAGTVIALLRKASRNGDVITWDIYRAPDSVGTFMRVVNSIWERKHAVRVVLLDAAGAAIGQESVAMQSFAGTNDAGIIVHGRTRTDLGSTGVAASWLGPVFWSKSGGYRFIYSREVMVQVELGRLGSVTQVAAFAEAVK